MADTHDFSRFDSLFAKWERQDAGRLKAWETRRARYGEKGHRPDAYMRNKVVTLRARVRARCHLRLVTVDGHPIAPGVRT